MSQALHIFRKDVRRLWPLIALVLALFALTAGDGIPRSGPPARIVSEGGFSAGYVDVGVYLLPLLLIPVCWIFAARVVHQEALRGDQQFWLTRPYERQSLLLAKLLFLSVFVLLPQITMGGLGEAHAGVPVLPNIGGLLEWGMVSSAWLILPGIAIAVVTRGMTGFVGALLAVSLAVGVYAFCGKVATNWFGAAVAAPGITNLAGYLPMIFLAIGAVLLQYNRRRTAWSLGLLAAALLAPALTLPADGPVTLSTRLRNSGFDPAQVHIAFDESSPPRFEGRTSPWHTCQSLRLKVDGLPRGATLESFGDSTPLEIEYGTGERPRYQAALEEFGDGFREIFCLQDAAYAATKGEDLTFRLQFRATVWSTLDETRVPLKKGLNVPIGSVGRCDIWPAAFGISCRLALPVFDSLNAGMEYEGYKVYSTTFAANRYSFPVSEERPGGAVGFEFSPSGATLGTQSPDIWDRPDATFVLRRERAIGYIERDLVYRGLRLADAVSR